MNSHLKCIIRVKYFRKLEKIIHIQAICIKHLQIFIEISEKYLGCISYTNRHKISQVEYLSRLTNKTRGKLSICIEYHIFSRRSKYLV